MTVNVPPIRCANPSCPAIGYWQMTSATNHCPIHTRGTQMTSNYEAAERAIDGLPIDGTTTTTQMIAIAQVFATLAIAERLNQ